MNNHKKLSTMQLEIRRARWDAPHSAGTTKELAKMLGVSRGTIRRLKQTGDLDRVIENYHEWKLRENAVA